MKKTSQIIFTVIFALFSISLMGQTYQEDAILGKWYNQDQTAIAKIYKENGKFYGKLIWLKEPLDPFTKKPKLDKNNPDESLRNRPVLNLLFLTDFVYDDGEWEDGKIYDPKTGKTYSCYMELKSPDKLKIRGYVGLAAFGKTTIWSKAKDAEVHTKTESANE